MGSLFSVLVLSLPLISSAQVLSNPAPKIYLLNSGFRIAESCIGSSWQQRLDTASKVVMSQGLSCLDSMPGSQAKNHAKRIRKLMKHPEVAPLLRCENLPGTFLARASLPQEEKIPYIEINTTQDPGDLNNILFHEVFHNIGYAHENEGAEYAYTCGECCFPNDGSREQQRLACQLCQTPKENAKSLNYEFQLMKFYSKNKRAEFATERLINFLKKNPKSYVARDFLRSHIEESYPSLVNAVQTSEPVGAYVNALFKSIEELLERPNITYKEVMPGIHPIAEFDVDHQARLGLISLYSAIQNLGVPTDRVTLVFLDPSGSGTVP